MEIDNYSLAKNIQKAEREGKETAFLFDRISSTRQDDGVSLDYQSESGNNYAEKNGLFVVQNFTLIESAYKEKRKYFDLILSLVAKHGIKHLIFKNPDRLSRNISHTAQYKKLIEENGVTFHFYELGQKINSQSSYDEQWMFFFFILMAQRHSLKLSHDIKQVYAHRAQKGIPQQKPPFGYKWDHELKKPVKDLAVKDTVEMIFREYDSGKYTLQSMCDFLNESGIKSSTGKKWRKCQVHQMLLNPYYSGEFMLWGQIHKGDYEPYFSTERFSQRKEKLGSNIGKNDSGEYPLSRLVKCAVCGSVFYGELKKEKYVYYTHQCLSSAGKRKYYSEKDFIEKINDEIMKIRYNPNLWDDLKIIFTDVISMKMRSSKSEKSHITSRISEIEAKEQRILDLYASEGIDINALKTKLNDYQKQKEVLEKQKIKFSIDQKDFIINVAELIETIKSLPGIWQDSITEKKSAILRKIVKSIKWKEDEVEIIYLEPFNYILNAKLLRQMDEAVRVNAFKLPRQDETRTIVNSIVEDLMLYFAA